MLGRDKTRRDTRTQETAISDCVWGVQANGLSVLERVSQQEIQPTPRVDPSRLLWNSNFAEVGNHYELKAETVKRGVTPPLSESHRRSVWLRGASRKGAVPAAATCVSVKAPQKAKGTSQAQTSAASRSASDMLGQSVIKQLLNKLFLKSSSIKAEDPESPKRPPQGAVLQLQQNESRVSAKERMQHMDRAKLASRLNVEDQGGNAGQSSGLQIMKQFQQQQSRQQPKTHKQEPDYVKAQGGTKIRPLKEEEVTVRADSTSEDVIAEFKRAILDQKHQRERGFNEQQKIARDVLGFAQLLPSSAQEKFLEASSAAYGAALERHLLAKRVPTTLHDLAFIQTLGHGGFGAVYLVQHRMTGEIYALKQVPKSRVSRAASRERQFAERDCLALCGANVRGTSGVVALQQTLQEGEHLYQLMQFLSGGSLMHYMHAKQRFDEPTVKVYIAQLVLAVREVHKLHYIHRDIKPDNIVFAREGYLKLLDFGLAKFAPHVFGDAGPRHGGELLAASAESCSSGATLSTDTSFQEIDKALETEQGFDGSQTDGKHSALHRPTCSLLKSICGTPMYTAPEVLLGQGYDHSVDWWSVGVVMFEMLYGGIPFCPPPKYKGDVPHFVKMQVANYAVVCPIPYPSSISNILSPEAINLMQRLVCDSSVRMKRASDILAHPFFRGLDLDHVFDQEQPLAADTEAYALKHYPLVCAVQDNHRDSNNPPSRGYEGTHSLETFVRKNVLQPVPEEPEKEGELLRADDKEVTRAPHGQFPRAGASGCLASLRAAARGAASRFGGPDSHQRLREEVCKPIPRRDARVDPEVDILFARYAFDRRVEDTRPRTEEVLADRRVVATLSSSLTPPATPREESEKHCEGQATKATSH